MPTHTHARTHTHTAHLPGNALGHPAGPEAGLTQASGPVGVAGCLEPPPDLQASAVPPPGGRGQSDRPAAGKVLALPQTQQMPPCCPPQQPCQAGPTCLGSPAMPSSMPRPGLENFLDDQKRAIRSSLPLLVKMPSSELGFTCGHP